MKFKKGNTINKLRKNPSGGPKVSPIKMEKDAMAADKSNVPKYLAVIREIALRKATSLCPHCKGVVLSYVDDKLCFTAANCMVERHEGKAKNIHDLTVTPKPLTNDNIDVLAEIGARQQKLLEQPVIRGDR